MFYYKWTEEKSPDNIVVMYTEINSDGVVTREIGLDNENKIVHKFPSKIYPYGTYGFFDLQLVSVTEGRPNIGKELFEKLWEWSEEEKIDFEI